MKRGNKLIFFTLVFLLINLIVFPLISAEDDAMFVEITAEEDTSETEAVPDSSEVEEGPPSSIFEVETTERDPGNVEDGGFKIFSPDDDSEPGIIMTWVKKGTSSVSSLYDIAKPPVLKFLGYREGFGFAGHFIYNLIIGLIAGTLLGTVLFILHILGVSILSVFGGKSTHRFTWARFIAGSPANVIGFGLVYALLMSVPVLNRVIEIITLYNLPSNWAWALLWRPIFLAIIAGILPQAIKSFITYREYSRVERLKYLSESGVKVAKGMAGA